MGGLAVAASVTVPATPGSPAEAKQIAALATIVEVGAVEFH